MEGKKPEQQRKDSSSSRGRFEAMSWLYRDGLSYQSLAPRPKSTKLPARSAEQPAPTSLTASAPVQQSSKKPAEQGRGDRFKSMSWLYRDGLQGSSTGQQAPEKGVPVSAPVAKPTPKQQPVVSELTTPTSQINKPISQSKSLSKKHDAKYEAMRWLYEDEASFEEAIKGLKAEEAAKLLKKEQAKQARKERVRNAYVTIQAQTMRVVQYARTEPKKALIGGGVGAAVIVIIVFGSIGMSRDGNSDSAKVAGDATANQTDPEFDALLPNNDSSQAGSGIAYDEKRKVANYIDTVDSTRITLSQQPVPERFTVNQAVELEKFAKEINANQFIQAGDTKAYAGLSVEGPQTVVLIKNDLLVFMKADKEISTGAWMAYIESLE